MADIGASWSVAVRTATHMKRTCPHSADTASGTRRSPADRAPRALLLTDDEVRAKTKLVNVSGEFAEWAWRPQTTDGPFDFTDPDYLREGFRL